jgi:hypothetical protein
LRTWLRRPWSDGSQTQTLASALLRCNDQAGGSTSARLKSGRS